MIRKVRLNKETGLKQLVKKLRDRFGSLINAANAGWYSLFKEEIRHSIASDGVSANRKETSDALEDHKPANQKVAAIYGYSEAARAMYEYAHNQFIENEFVLRMSDIKQIHTLLMRYEKNPDGHAGGGGDFRKKDAQVPQAALKPINMFYVREAMELLIKFFNESYKQKTYDDVTLAAITYVWFEKIHPFSDGNGRTGRILLSYILIGQGLLNVAIKGISKQELDKYRDVLKEPDRCLGKIHRLIVKNKKLNPADINNSINKEAFAPLAQMISGSIEEAVDRLEGSKAADLNKEAVLPLRHLAKIYDYSQDYLRNLINRGQLNASKKGKLWYARVQDLEAYINSRNAGGEDPSLVAIIKEAIEENRENGKQE